MFADKTQWKENELRQGDVLSGVPFPYTSILRPQIIGGFGTDGQKGFPQLAATMHGLSPGSNDETFFTGQLPMKLAFCAVMTQCCELVCNAQGKLRFIQAISVCRLVPLTLAMKASADKLKMIRSNPDIRKENAYKNYFYYGAPAEVGGHEELMADFNQTACIPSREFPELMSAKVLQLDDRTRMKFKLRLGFFHASPTDEEIALGIEKDPWSEPGETVEAQEGQRSPVEMPAMPPKS